MKRYRIVAIDFDTRANVLNAPIGEGWEPANRALWEQNKAIIRNGLVHQYGALDFEHKFERFVTLGAAPFSVVAFHNAFLRQARSAFVIGAFYPALTAACALGERVLNTLCAPSETTFRARQSTSVFTGRTRSTTGTKRSKRLRLGTCSCPLRLKSFERCAT
jgi:hypothetical protein